MLNGNDVAELGLFASDLWHRKYAEILSAFDNSEKDGIDRTLAAYIRTSPRDPGIEAAVRNSDISENPDREVMDAFSVSFSRAFITLWDRGALTRLLLFDEIPALVQQQMDQMVKEASQGIASAPLVAATEEEPPVEIKPEAQCVLDFHAMPSDQFRRKWVNDSRRRPVYDAVVANNLV